MVELVFINEPIIFCHPLPVNQMANFNLFMWPTDALGAFWMQTDADC